MYIPRPYQELATERCVRFFRESKKTASVAVLPTGSGKSHIIADTARVLGEPLLIFQPRKEILEQNRNKLRDVGINPAVFSASMGSKEIGDVTLATILSAVKHPEQFDHFKHIIVDECDLVNPKQGSYKELFMLFERHKILGLTATPFRLRVDGFGVMLRTITRSKPRIFQSVCHITQIQELVENGWWAPLEYYSIGNFNRGRLKLNTTRTDYDESSLRTYYGDTRFNEGLLKVVHRLLDIGRRGVLIFTRFVDEANTVAQAVGGAIVTGKTPKRERERIVRLFRSGRIRAVACVDTLSVGFDYPELDTIVLARPTLSLRLYYQQVGRGVRPHPEKFSTMIVDLCANIRTFGKVEEFEFFAEGKAKQLAMRGSRGQLTDVYL